MALLTRARGVALFAALAAAFALAPAQAASFQEYQVKAVFLLNFARFVDWPAGTFSAPAQPIGICIAGDNPFGGYLEEAVRGEQVDGHPFAIRELRGAAAPDGCHILFVARSAANDADALVRAAAVRHVLTVSDIPQFVEHGGMIGFETRDNRVRLAINAELARHQGLMISTKLLRIASVVPG
jgi:hypothetical protein